VGLQGGIPAEHLGTDRALDALFGVVFHVNDLTAIL
jgi:hypothetical protein